jgi:phosphoribosyl-ATP pyrophosphohydrolase/phosphoribosyl-AMP cyclohydrolase
MASSASADLPRPLLQAEVARLDSLRYNEQGLIPAIVQDYLDGTVLMMAWMNRESLQKTLETGRTWFWSRSRQTLWPKGETSGHVQWVKQIRYDCDGDALVILVEQVGDAACHTGARSCFFRPLPGDQRDPLPAADTLSQVFAVVKARQADPRPDSYTSSLLAKGENAILKKLGEETAEVVMAAKDQDRAALAREVADLWYHCLVALAHYQVDIKDVYRQLQARRSAK